MIKIANAQFWVHDQDEALAFYTRTLGWEVRADVTMEEWNFRWLVVGPVGQDDVGLVLMPVPRPPMLDADEQRPARRAGRQGRRRHAVPRDRRLPGRLRRAVGARRRLQRPADAAALRHRHVVPRPVGQQHPPHPGARVLARPPLTRLRGGCRGERHDNRPRSDRFRREQLALGLGLRTRPHRRRPGVHPRGRGAGGSGRARSAATSWPDRRGSWSPARGPCARGWSYLCANRVCATYLLCAGHARRLR